MFSKIKLWWNRHNYPTQRTSTEGCFCPDDAGDECHCGGLTSCEEEEARLKGLGFTLWKRKQPFNPNVWVNDMLGLKVVHSHCYGR